MPRPMGSFLACPMPSPSGTRTLDLSIIMSGLWCILSSCRLLWVVSLFFLARKKCDSKKWAREEKVQEKTLQQQGSIHVPVAPSPAPLCNPGFAIRGAGWPHHHHLSYATGYIFPALITRERRQGGSAGGGGVGWWGRQAGRQPNSFSWPYISLCHPQHLTKSSCDIYFFLIQKSGRVSNPEALKRLCHIHKCLTQSPGVWCVLIFKFMSYINLTFCLNFNS